jgi:hypothetical protein
MGLSQETRPGGRPEVAWNRQRPGRAREPRGNGRAGVRIRALERPAGGSAAIVWYSWTPVSEQGRIIDMSGKQLAIVGGKHFAALGPDLDSWPVQGTEWAIKGEGNTLVTIGVLDRATKKLVKIELPRCPLRLALRHSGS